MRGGWLSGRRHGYVGEIEGIKADLSSALNRMARMTHSARGDIGNQAASLADVRDRASDAAQGLMSQGRDWYDSAENEFLGGVSRARKSVERNPLAGLAIAAGVGFLLGLVTRR